MCAICMRNAAIMRDWETEKKAKFKLKLGMKKGYKAGVLKRTGLIRPLRCQIFTHFSQHTHNKRSPDDLGDNFFYKRNNDLAIIDSN